MSLLERKVRRVQNSKGNAISEGSNKTAMSHPPAKNNMSDGEQVFALLSNRTLGLFKKLNGMLYKVNLSHDGNQIVDNKLTAKRIEYINEFTDYRIFTHNITGDIGTAEAYLAWFTGRGDSNMDSANTAYLTPYTMTCEKIVFRPEVLTDTSADLTFKIKKQDDGDVTVDTVATATYTATLASHTSIVIKRTDFDNTPTVGDKDKVAISVTAGADPSGTIDWYATSVWRTEIKV
jgi:hypothetical protein|tara:strand:+ start:720 stop:1421 length:702 start_codon:yes stop_codon:yes gene_type:complete